MSKRKSVALKLVPYPSLAWEQFFWVGTIHLPAWKGFLCRLGPYGTKSSRKPSNGETRLTIRPPVRSSTTPPSSEQSTAYQYLVEQQKAIRDTILEEVFDEYPTYRAKY